MQIYKKGNHHIRFSNHSFISSENLSKTANQQPPHQSPPTTSQELPTTPTNTRTNNPQSSTRISCRYLKM